MKVSVIIPCHNQAAFLARAIESVLAQTEPPEEIIVVNDRSTDAPGEVAARYPVIYCEADVGNPARARSAGLAAATGDAIALLDADNELFPHFLERHAAVLAAHPWAGWTYADRWIVHEPGSDWYPFPDGPASSGTFSIERLARENYIDTCALIRRTALREIGDAFPIGTVQADYQLWLTLVERGWRGVHLPEPLFRYYVHARNISRDMRSLTPSIAAPFSDPVGEYIREEHQQRHPFWTPYEHINAVHTWWYPPSFGPDRSLKIRLAVSPLDTRDTGMCRIVVRAHPALELRDLESLGDDPAPGAPNVSNVLVADGFPTIPGSSDILFQLERTSRDREPGGESGMLLWFWMQPTLPLVSELTATPWWIGTRGVTAGITSAIQIRIAPP